MSYHESFTRLHQGPSPLLLANCWDVQSAKTIESAGYSAVGFSSHALSTALGYEDGENLPFDLLLRMTKRVVESIKIPFTVDMEGGFSRNIDGILDNILRLHEAGVAGINLEDTVTEGSNRFFLPAKDFAKTIEAITGHLQQRNLKLFINIRTDGFLLNLPAALPETLTRIRLYEAAGANGIFVPCITGAADIRQVVDATALPINVMAIPGLPDLPSLQALGVRRISMGPFLFSKVYAYAADLARKVYMENNLLPLLS